MLKGNSPIFDDTDGKILQEANKLNKEVFFLTGKYFSEANRTIVVNSNQSIFFPVIEAPYAYQGSGLFSFDQNALKLTEKDDVNTVFYHKAELDGKPLENFRAKAFFNTNYNVDNTIFGLPAGQNLPTLVDGYWVFLKQYTLEEKIKVDTTLK